MRLYRRKPIVVALVGGLALAQYGCAVARVGGPSLAEIREAAGVVGVASPPGVWKGRLKTPDGKGIAAAKGAGAGAAAGAGPGLAVTRAVSGCNGGGALGAVICGSVLLVGLGIAATGGVLGAFGGAVYGAASTETPSREVTESLRSTVAQLDVHKALRERVLEVADRRPELSFVHASNGTAAKRADVSPAEAGGPDVDTVLEVTLDHLELRHEGSEPGLPVVLVISARARLGRWDDGRELYRHVARHQSESRPYAEWAVDDARHLRNAIAAATTGIAEEIIDIIFVRPVEPAPPVASPPPASALPRVEITTPSPPQDRPAPGSREWATKQAACHNRYLAFRSDWRDHLPAYRECLAD